MRAKQLLIVVLSVILGFGGVQMFELDNVAEGQFVSKTYKTKKTSDQSKSKNESEKKPGYDKDTIVMPMGKRSSGDDYDRRRAERLEDELDDLEDENDRLKRQMLEMQGELQKLGNANQSAKEDLARRERELEEAGKTQGREIAWLREEFGKIKNERTQKTDIVRKANELVLQYATESEWEWKPELIWDEQRGDIYFTHENGAQEKQSFWSMNPKKVGVRAIFLNTSQKAGSYYLRFRVLKKPFDESGEVKDGKAIVMGYAVYTTPFLAAGEACELERWIPVREAEMAGEIEMMEVMRRVER
ncbi:hypothetical protein KS4_30130 [Poriferisphaera corsica]|uniref:Uncharacterized protein n=1 Tax=Poriferisphaera corsica TaxID=2528020 RepID=A0A517YXI6_9BACT|nr:hypothetical protein [Poriferisphaera corsica]QDU34936.1 hypothetical protein KS4_30130 [Poriferisphaera corsica]